MRSFTYLEAALSGDLPIHLASAGRRADEQVASVVDEPGDGLRVHLPTELHHRRRQDDEVLVQVLAILGQDEVGVVRELEC